MLSFCDCGFISCGMLQIQLISYKMFPCYISDQWNLDQSSYGKAAVSKASNAARQQPYSTVGVARGAGGATRGNSASTGRGTGRGAGAAGASRGGMHR